VYLIGNHLGLTIRAKNIYFVADNPMSIPNKLGLIACWKGPWLIHLNKILTGISLL
jgi:hypothetical protein